MHLARGARVAVCGSISNYEAFGPDMGETLAKTYGVKGTTLLIERRASMRGFLVLDYIDRAIEGMAVTDDLRAHRLGPRSWY